MGARHKEGIIYAATIYMLFFNHMLLCWIWHVPLSKKNDGTNFGGLDYEYSLHLAGVDGPRAPQYFVPW